MCCHGRTPGLANGWSSEMISPIDFLTYSSPIEMWPQHWHLSDRSPQVYLAVDGCGPILFRSYVVLPNKD